MRGRVICGQWRQERCEMWAGLTSATCQNAKSGVGRGWRGWTASIANMSFICHSRS